MADEIEILVFEISGEANYSQTTPHPTSGNQGSEETLARKKQKQKEKDDISNLNKKAEKIAGDIQGEMRKYLMHRFKVQAEIGFSRGSIILTGTVALINCQFFGFKPPSSDGKRL